MGYSYSGEEEVVINRLQAMEMRQKSTVNKGSTSRVENSLSDDKAN